MRCYCCNRPLNEYESTLKSNNTEEYLDTCQKCLDGLGIDYTGNNDLNPYDPVDDDFTDWEDYHEPEEDNE